MVIHIPYELIEKTFGTFIADHFNEISVILLIAGYLVINLFRNNNRHWLNDAQRKNRNRFEYMNRNIIEASEARQAKEKRSKEGNTDSNAFSGSRQWYPTGWTFNEKTQLWEPPDYLKNSPAPIRKKDNEPTFEEWKAAREAEQNKDQSTT